MPQASRWLLALGIAGSALAVGTVHTVTLCIVNVVLAADVWSRALSPLREPGPSWAPITLDPIATRVEVLEGVAYLLAFVTAA